MPGSRLKREGRKDSAKAVIFASVDSSRFFGWAENFTGKTIRSCGGTVSTWIDGVALAGGEAATCGQLDTALSVGGWHILECRNMDLSLWTDFKVSDPSLGGYQMQGGIGGVILCPAGDAATRQKNRQYLGNKVGLTLP